jgi:hypothetical protein
MSSVQRVARPIGELLVERGLINEIELADALAEQAKTKRPIGEILVSHGLVSRPALSLALADQLGVELEIEQGLWAGLWAEIARRHGRGIGTEHEHEIASSEFLPHEAVELPRDVWVEPVTGPVEPESKPEPGPAPIDRYLLASQELAMTLAATEAQLEEARAELAARQVRTRPVTTAHLLFVEFDQGYAVFAREGSPPRKATTLDVPELGNASFVVKKVGRSPFPLDRRRCAYLELRR